MEAFRHLVSTALPLRGANIDTDQILPSRFMQKPRGKGFGNYLFRDLRSDPAHPERPDFILDAPIYRGARILVAGENFGCGSSREQAVYAVLDYGFRCVIAPSLGDIFFINALKNGLLPAQLSGAEVDRLLDRCEADPAMQISVDLERQLVSYPGATDASFPIDGFRKELLLSGRDEIALTLGLADDIAAFETRRRDSCAWL